MKTKFDLREVTAKEAKNPSKTVCELFSLYGSKIPELYAALKPIVMGNEYAKKPAFPLLLDLGEDEQAKEYDRADLRVMIFGRENNNWNNPDGKETYEKFDFSSSDEVFEEVNGLMDLYDKFFHYDHTYWTRFMDCGPGALSNLLKEKYPDKKICCLWNNICKIGIGRAESGGCRGEAPLYIHEAEREHFDVIRDEIRILKPDVLVFMVGHTGDKYIKEVFGDVRYTPANPAIQELDFLDIPDVKCAVRMVYPLFKKWTLLNSCYDAILKEINRLL